MESILLKLSDSVSGAQTLEELTRPLLEMLHAVTGLESTYLTSIDLEKGLQHILYARNTSSTFAIPEGLTVDWNDTLCKRALDENRGFTNEVSDCWGDSDAARALGIQTYLSTPIRTGGGNLYGTLCAASASRREVTPDIRKIIDLFARLIAQHVERESLLNKLREANIELSAMALTDPLTSLPNRRALLDELARMFAIAQRETRSVLIAFLDLDGFKQINDTWGHDAGDALLQTIAQQLAQQRRAGDFIARVGGDEFVAVGVGPRPGEQADDAAEAFGLRLFERTRATVGAGKVQFDYAGASVGAIAIDPAAATISEALSQADSAMYKVKQRRARRTPSAC
ncbi:sensor domain-containing diguanylate cyclase [Silvimonas amylolytica]|uniref:diguanylate cyclase n=1 Tax=Silvimonas amylolytica TaxID=449663 RepID=A0ABQ2PSD0_9NEIS|nr:sensor domain-containing diguanylate cyclase [Silvimonas amylolytica]GGP28163.1 GGDEF domain-containing protein [Silvimonas amylolytica]